MSATEASAFSLHPRIPEAFVPLGARPSGNDNHHLDLYVSTDPLKGDQITSLAQRLHTATYLEKGFIAEGDLTGGVFIDPYAERSTYFYAVNGRKEAAARQINCDRSGIISLPTAKKFSVDPDIIRQVANVKHLADLKPSETVEISGLAARRKEGGKGSNLDGVIALYSKMIAHSVEKGHKLWLLNADPVYLRQLKGLIGEEQVHVLGPEREYMGPATVPVALSPLEITRRVFTADDPASLMIRRHFTETFRGISDKNIPKDIRQLIAQNDIPLEHYSLAARIATNPKTWIQAAIMGYSATRAIPAAMIDQFQGSPGALWTIDVATSIPYAWGVTEAFTGKTTRRRLGGAAVGAACFVAPYAYFYWKGNEYPAAVNAVVGGFITAAVAKEVLSRRSRAKKDVRVIDDLRTIY